MEEEKYSITQIFLPTKGKKKKKATEGINEGFLCSETH